ncbi:MULTISPECIES: SDR family oxidoreductase [unclassified Mycobacterium]|uniref:SDR family oxidoreductase n=1 Tax=unclassified Mycobacterium TaxID=2642494 RepID=UPI0007FCC665|nr:MULTISPECIES: SDR family oxidoreductase [unclassified Mycobacterium]OBG56667.1 3-beta hydroxysteroid dehydrogenase [Mycobacterium sp. E735]OBG60282.1 3-beta hydroxysteroid dehydrogenase [Mycobacterium sp. E188]OBH42856.1 3-beta hydroxysteroid dehydrogenase [Mycobacterium sp. E183]
MRVFVTGATGGIGSAVVPELIGAGHQVLALARSDASARAARALGADVLPGDLDDPDSLRTGAKESDGVVHLAFLHFDDFEKAVAQEAGAVEAFGAALDGTGKPFVMASGTPPVPGRASTERDAPPTEGPIGGRAHNAHAALELAARGVRSAVVRLPRSVHRAGGPCGFASLLVEAARRTGVSGYVGDGTQRWPAVHVLDAARLFRLVLEEATPGTVAHAVADEGDPMRALAEAIGGQLGLPAASVPAEHFGPLGAVYALDQPASSELTRERFGWQPTHPSLLADLEAGNYPS